jgi:hypothetical protein
MIVVVGVFNLIGTNANDNANISPNPHSTLKTRPAILRPLNPILIPPRTRSILFMRNRAIAIITTASTHISLLIHLRHLKSKEVTYLHQMHFSQCAAILK